MGMSNTGHNGNKSGYLVILLLAVGLTAFSTSMKELYKLHQVTFEASRSLAAWSDVVPNEIPQTAVKIETCENKAFQQSIPSVELPWLDRIEQDRTIEENMRSKADRNSVVKVRKAHRVDMDPVQLEVRIPTDHSADEADDEAVTAEIPVALFKTKVRKQGLIRLNTRDREMLLKTLNRSYNFRFAG